MSKAARRGKIFIDYLRNQHGASTVVAYSTRTKSGAPVSFPLSWDELPKLSGPQQYTVENVPRILAKRSAIRGTKCCEPLNPSAAAALKKAASQVDRDSRLLSSGRTQTSLPQPTPFLNRELYPPDSNPAVNRTVAAHSAPAQILHIFESLPAVVSLFRFFSTGVRAMKISNNLKWVALVMFAVLASRHRSIPNSAISATRRRPAIQPAAEPRNQATASQPSSCKCKGQRRRSSCLAISRQPRRSRPRQTRRRAQQQRFHQAIRQANGRRTFQVHRKTATIR